MKEKLTIVIPCKNENENIYECIGFIAKQVGCTGTKVIIADTSDDEQSLWWLWKAQNEYKYSLNIEVIKGGFPADRMIGGKRYLNSGDWIENMSAILVDYDGKLYLYQR